MVVSLIPTLNYEIFVLPSSVNKKKCSVELHNDSKIGWCMGIGVLTASSFLLFFNCSTMNISYVKNINYSQVFIYHTKCFTGDPPSPGKLATLKEVLSRYKQQLQKLSNMQEEINKRYIFFFGYFLPSSFNFE